jgi:hypothetical protein
MERKKVGADLMTLLCHQYFPHTQEKVVENTILSTIIYRETKDFLWHKNAFFAETNHKRKTKSTLFHNG